MTVNNTMEVIKWKIVVIIGKAIFIPYYYDLTWRQKKYINFLKSLQNITVHDVTATTTSTKDLRS